MKALPALCAVLLSLLTALPLGARAQQSGSFVVDSITVQGLERIDTSTVLAYTGFASGDLVNEQVLSAAISRLFETGLFRDIEIVRDGASVVIALTENPTISTIRFEGMEALNEETVLDLIKGRDIAAGRVFKRDTGEIITGLLGSFYRQNSYFLSSAQVVTVPLESNRVDVVVSVTEGQPSRIASIAVHGAEVFDEDELLDLLELRTEGLINSFFDRDIYLQEVFEGDLERLRQHYFERGYIRFAVLDTDVRVHTDTNGIEIDILVSEGAQYRFGEYTFASPVPVGEDEVAAAEVFAAGEVYSEVEVEQFRARLVALLRNRGHAFAAVTVSERISDEQLQVSLDFAAEPGRVASVRRIDFVGNNLTRDEVLRRQLEIVEGERFSQEKLDFSLVRLRRNRYLRQAQAIENRVGEDEVDLSFDVVESTRGTFLIGAGFSNASGVSFSLDILRNNILGSGNDLDLRFETDDDSTTIRTTFVQPNITDSGITRTFDIFSVNDRPDDNVTSDNSVDRLGTGLSYNVPIDRNWSWDVGIEYEQAKLNSYDAIIARDTAPDDPPELDEGDFDNDALAYALRYGPDQNAYYIDTGVRYNSLNRAFSPSEGIDAQANLRTAAAGSDAQHYQLTFRGSYYRPLELDQQYILKFSGEARYGDTYTSGDVYPFYKRYLLPSSRLRGFDTDRLGPQNANRSIGGRFLLAVGAEIERPLDVLDGESVRGGLFVDAAGLWDSVGHFHAERDDLKVAGGVFVRVRTPIFPIVVSYGFPLRREDGDNLQRFQFRVGF